MLKKITILFILFNYLNTSVFLPEIVPFTSVSSAICHTNEYDEINSLVEFVIDKCLAEDDQTPEDEDDDIPDDSKFGEKEGIEDHICGLFAFLLWQYADLSNTKKFIRNDKKVYCIFVSLHYSPPELA